MNNKLSGILTLAISLCFSMPAMAGTTDAALQASSTLSSVCTISATPVNFGALSFPLNSQSASGSMDVLCNKGTPYTIDLAYGGMYGAGTVVGSLNYYSSQYLGSTPSGAIFSCRYSGSINGSDYSTSTTEYGSCPNTTSYTASTSFAYGKMIGAAKNDTIAYAIYIPNDSSKVWNIGVNSYSETGTGLSQSIPLSGKIVPSQSGSSYPTPDMYTDTVTAKITY